MYNESAPGEFSAKDFVKSIGVFFWNTLSLISALLIAVVALPQDQLPDSLMWIVPLSGLLNAVAFALKTWAEDNRP